MNSVELNQALAEDSFVLLHLFAPWEGLCQKLMPEFEKSAEALKGVVTVAVVDVSQPLTQGVAEEYKARGFPTILFLGKDRQPVTYNNSLTAQSFAQFATQEVVKAVDARLGLEDGNGGGQDDDDVFELTDANFEQHVLRSGKASIVYIYASWNGHCQLLTPEWKRAAEEIKKRSNGKVKLYSLHAVDHTSTPAKYGVQGYPHFVVFKANGEVNEDAPRPIPRIWSNITSYAMTHLA